METLIDQTEAALPRVLSLCSSGNNGGVGQEDVDALQRHDEATLSLLEVNDDDAIKVGAWVIVTKRGVPIPKVSDVWFEAGQRSGRGTRKTKLLHIAVLFYAALLLYHTLHSHSKRAACNTAVVYRRQEQVAA